MIALANTIRRARVPVREVSAGDRLAPTGGCLIEVLHPAGSSSAASDNAGSIVLAIEYQGKRILIPGDLESSGLEDLLAHQPWDTDVLLAPHHGSGRSDPPGLAAWCEPEWVVISGSIGSYQPETTASYHASGAKVLHTGAVGAVDVLIDASALEVGAFLASGEE